MSGFLKKFSNEEYENVKNKINAEIEEIDDVVDNVFSDASNVEDKIDDEIDIVNELMPKNPIEAEVKKSNINEIIKNEAPTKMNKNVFQTSNTRDERLVRDDEKINKRRIKIVIAIIIVLALIIGGFFGYKEMNKLSVPSFALEKNLGDVEIWAAKNKIQLDSTTEFSVKADEGVIISQSQKSGTSIQKGSSFKVVVSKGADLNERLKLPKFETMKLIEIESWKEKNKASNLMIEKVFSEDVASGTFISMAFKTEGIDSSNYRRKDKLVVTVSKGKEVFEKNIVVSDFKNKAKAEVDTWANEKGVKVEYSEQASPTVMEGNVISQDIEPKTKIAKNDVIKIVVSRGKISNVPNFSGLDETMATIEATKSGVTITSVKYYNNQVATGQLISQSIPAGTEVSTESIVLIYSSGKPYVGNFDGQDLFVLVQSINEMNGLGANLSYEVQEVESSEPKGVIITSNVKASFVNTGTRIIITVSRGK